MLTGDQIAAELFAARSASTCLELLAATRDALRFSIVGFRGTLRRPVVDQIPDPDAWATRFGWPDGFKQGWLRGGHASNFPHTGRRQGQLPGYHWKLPEPERGIGISELRDVEIRAIQYMRSFGISEGITVRVRRPFGHIGCVSWMLPELREGAEEFDQLLGTARQLSRQFFESFDHCAGWGNGGPLSPRGLECLALAALGMSDKRIAIEIGRSVDTVRFHMKSVIAQLDAVNRTHAVALAIRDGLIPAPDDVKR